MSIKPFNLETYALLATALLGTDKLKAQLITLDFDPDLRLMNWEDYDDELNQITIDIDDNGIMDLVFNYNVAPHYADITLDIYDCVIGVGIESSGVWNAYNIEFFNSGQLIAESNIWADAGNIIFKGSCQISVYGENSSVSYAGSPFLSKYLPLKLQIDSEIHYGWIRLSIDKLGNAGMAFDNCWPTMGSPLTIFSISYNAIANESVLCNENILPEPGSIIEPGLGDFLDTQTASDFGFIFNAEEPDYSEIRFYLVPSRNDIINFTVNDALLLDTSRYFSIAAEQVIAGIENVFNLPETLLDINGNEFVQGRYYSGFYMKIPLVGGSNEYTLSTPLNVQITFPWHCKLNVSPIEMEFITNKGCFEVSFSKDFDGADISSYGVGIVSSKNINDIEEYISGYSKIDTTAVIIVPKTFANNYVVDLIGLKKDIFGESLVPGVEYAPVVVGFGDGYNRDLFCYSYNYEFIELPFIAYEAVQIFYFDNILSVDVLPEMIDNCKLEVVSILGQKILTTEITQEKSTIDIGRLSKGIYLVVIYQDNEQVEKFKFEKN